MAGTFGEYIMAGRIDWQTANAALIRRIRATSGMGEVSTFHELMKCLGKITPAQEMTIRAFWRAYRAALRRRDA